MPKMYLRTYREVVQHDDVLEVALESGIIARIRKTGTCSQSRHACSLDRIDTVNVLAGRLGCGCVCVCVCARVLPGTWLRTQ